MARTGQARYNAASPRSRQRVDRAQVVVARLVHARLGLRELVRARVGDPRGLRVRACGDTDLTLTVLGQTATVTGLAAPTDREPASLVWFDVGELFVDAPIELALTATRGAFGWIADPDPIVRLAVSTTPAAERVAVGGAPIDLTGDETVLIGLALAGTDRWDVETDQFCTVSMANAVMEFAP